MASTVCSTLPGSGRVSFLCTVWLWSRDTSFRLSVRAATATSYPASARASAIALPIPRLPPVTSARTVIDPFDCGNIVI